MLELNGTRVRVSSNSGVTDGRFHPEVTSVLPRIIKLGSVSHYVILPFKHNRERGQLGGSVS